MARGPGKKKSSDPHDDRKGTEPHPQYVCALVKEQMEAKSKAAEINGSFGERMKKACDEGGVNRKAFAMAAAVARVYRNQGEFEGDSVLRAFNKYVLDLQSGGLLGERHVGDLAEMAKNDEGRQSPEEIEKAVMEGIKPLKESDQEFDDATSSKPSSRARRSGGVGDAEGSYQVKH